MSTATANAIDGLAEELAALQLQAGNGEPLGRVAWIERASRIDPDSRGAPRSFNDPRRPGLSEAWGQATLKRLAEMLADARRPLPL